MSVLDRLKRNREKENSSNDYTRGYMHALRDLEELIAKSENLSDEDLIQALCEAISDREIL